MTTKDMIATWQAQDKHVTDPQKAHDSHKTDAQTHDWHVLVSLWALTIYKSM